MGGVGGGEPTLKLALATTATALLTGFFFFALARAEAAVLAALAAVFVVLPVAYLLGSALSPARPDRTCPACGAEGLVPLTPGAAAGVRCTTCGRVDKAASTALLDAEADPPPGKGSAPP